jgi:hypothetical protein
MENDKEFKEYLDRLCKNVNHWLEIRKVLEDEIKGNTELILLIDKRVKEIEIEKSKLN